MKPYPLASSNHFTVPVAINTHLLSTHHERGGHTALRYSLRLRAESTCQARSASPDLAPVARARLRRRWPRIGDVGKQRHLSCALDCDAHLPLMPAARACDARRTNLAPLRDESPQLTDVLVVDLANLVPTERARLPSRRLATVPRSRLRLRLHGHVPPPPAAGSPLLARNRGRDRNGMTTGLSGAPCSPPGRTTWRTA